MRKHFSLFVFNLPFPYSIYFTPGTPDIKSFIASGLTVSFPAGGMLQLVLVQRLFCTSDYSHRSECHPVSLCLHWELQMRTTVFQKQESEKATMSTYKSMFCSLFLKNSCFSFFTALEYSQLMFSQNYQKSRFCSWIAIVSSNPKHLYTKLGYFFAICITSFFYTDFLYFRSHLAL